MYIMCPYCGDRDTKEFAYLGGPGRKRPDPNDTDSLAQFVDFAYFRENPAGPHRELWFHRAGCRRWLEVTRDTRTHEISEVQFAKPPIT